MISETPAPVAVDGADVCRASGLVDVGQVAGRARPYSVGPRPEPCHVDQSVAVGVFV